MELRKSVETYECQICWSSYTASERRFANECESPECELNEPLNTLIDCFVFIRVIIYSRLNLFLSVFVWFWILDACKIGSTRISIWIGKLFVLHTKFQYRFFSGHHFDMLHSIFTSLNAVLLWFNATGIMLIKWGGKIRFFLGLLFLSIERAETRFAHRLNVFYGFGLWLKIFY